MAFKIRHHSVLPFLLCLLLQVVVSFPSSSSLVTSVPQGRLRGKSFTTREGRNISVFLSIPYAAPPIGQLRFKSPQPPLGWEGEYSATREAPGCIQNQNPPRVPTRPSAVSEDCLYLNVFTPNVKPTVRYPVLVFIHGGGFETGSGNSSAFGPDYLLDEDAILVTLNYRLGILAIKLTCNKSAEHILGFMTLENHILPGNLGLKDQRAALRWVKANIMSFGGDPKKITIFGSSSGAASVQLHLMFNKNEGLFRAGICDSGSSLTPFAVQWPGVQRPLVDKLATLSNCTRSPDEEFLQCLRGIPAEKFEAFRKELGKTNIDIKRHFPVFPPVIEPTCAEDAFITADPWNRTLDFPILQGVNQYEGLFRTVEFEVDKTDNNFMELNMNYKEVLPYNLYIDNTAKNPEEVAEMLKNFYFKGDNISRKTYLQLVDLFSDGLYNYPLVVSTRLNRAKTFVYQLNYKGANSLVHYLGSQAYYGVSHTDELFFLFPFGGPTERNVTEVDTILSKKLVKLWTNFATFLNPTPPGIPNGIQTRWTPSKLCTIQFLNITQHNFNMERNFLKQRMDFWKTVPFRNKPFPGRIQC